MIDCILGYAKGYSRKQILPFLKSLLTTGYEGMVIMFADGEAAEALKSEHGTLNMDVRPVPAVNTLPHAERFYHLKDVIPKDAHGVLLLDTRDVIFQENPCYLPSDILNVFEEDDSMTIGKCPYNSLWIKTGYGEISLKELSSKPILCVGSFCGDARLVKRYLDMLVSELKRIQPRTNDPQDQAAHNWLCNALEQTPTPPFRWKNEHSPIYTVGYIPRETVQIQGGYIMNKMGNIPAVVHQWDRHHNLTDFVEKTYVHPYQ